MEKKKCILATRFFEGLGIFLCRCMFSIISIGPIPMHIAFIMDGNRRYATKNNLGEGSGHEAGFVTLMNMLKYCYELNVKYVTVYAFSIDNFKRRPQEVQSTMQLIQEKIEQLSEEESVVNRYGVRVHFIGNLKLLSNSVVLAAQKIMEATAGNSKVVLSVCIAYTATEEIAHAVDGICKEKCEEFNGLDARGAGYGVTRQRGIGKTEHESLIDLRDIEKHMRMAVAPDPDIIIRTSGETRLSNFLLWQSASSLLYSPAILWPEIGLWHFVQAILDFQRNFSCLRKE